MCSNSNPSDSFLTCLTDFRTLTATHVIVHSLPTTRGTESLRYSNNAELLGELELLKIELVDDFFVELMLAAKFPYPLPTHCVPGSEAKCLHD